MPHIPQFDQSYVILRRCTTEVGNTEASAQPQLGTKKFSKIFTGSEAVLLVDRYDTYSVSKKLERLIGLVRFLQMPLRSPVPMKQGYAKLVGFDFSIGIEFEFSISNLGFDIDSGLCEVLVLVSVLTQTRIKY